MEDEEYEVDEGVEIDDIGVCTECHSDQPDQYMIRNPFFQMGKPVPCKYCGGIVMIVLRERRKAALNQKDASRGVYRKEDDDD